VRAFYQAAIVDKDFDVARQLVGDDYVQHNPLILDGSKASNRLSLTCVTRSPTCRSPSSTYSPTVTT
jgi:predicted SnoaL-like aldol condensation-catalyzing enzyme